MSTGDFLFTITTLLSYQRDVSFIDDIITLPSRPRNDNSIEVSTHILGYALEGTIPSLLHIIGIEHLLSPPVVYTELNHVLELNANRAEHIVKTITVRCEA